MSDKQIKEILRSVSYGFDGLATSIRGILSTNVEGSLTSIANGLRAQIDTLDNQFKIDCLNRKGPNATQLRNAARIQQLEAKIIENIGEAVVNYPANTERVIKALTPAVYENSYIELLEKFSAIFSFNANIGADQRFISWHPRDYSRSFKENLDKCENKVFMARYSFDVTLNKREFKVLEKQHNGCEVESRITTYNSGPRISVNVLKDILEETNYSANSSYFNQTKFIEHFFSMMKEFGFDGDGAYANRQDFENGLKDLQSARPTPEWLTEKFKNRSSYYGYQDAWYTEYLDDNKVHWVYCYSHAEDNHATITLKGIDSSIESIEYGNNTRKFVTSAKQLQEAGVHDRAIYLTPQTWYSLLIEMRDSREDYLNAMKSEYEEINNRERDY